MQIRELCALYSKMNEISENIVMHTSTMREKNLFDGHQTRGLDAVIKTQLKSPLSRGAIRI